MRRYLLAGFAILLVAAITAECTLVQGSSATTPRPKLTLNVSAHHGISPLSLKLIGTIENLDPKRRSECRIRIDWVNDTGIGFPFRTREEISCVRGGDVRLAPSRFERTLNLDKAGKYSYRIVLQSKGSNQLLSASREVKVFQSGKELKVKVGGAGA
jgi:hypothetical protein